MQQDIVKRKTLEVWTFLSLRIETNSPSDVETIAEVGQVRVSPLQATKPILAYTKLTRFCD